VSQQRRQSQKEELAGLRDELRAQGRTYQEIAQHLRQERRVNSRVAFRLAHGLTQQHVADRWNDLWPAEDGETPITYKHISYWEAWPSRSGRTPSLQTLNRLARIYCCKANDLLDGEDYSNFDSAVVDRQDELSRADLALGGSKRVIDRGQQGVLVVPNADSFFGASEEVPVSNDFVGQLLRNFGALVSEGGNAALPARQRDAAFKQLVQFLVTWAHTMNRREVLRILGWAATAAAAAPIFQGLDLQEQERVVGAIQAPNRVDAAVVDHIEGVLWRCMRQDDSLGPQAALDTVLAQRNLAYAILAECPDTVRPRLLSTFANLSRFAGWLSFDLNDFDGGWYYYEQARTAAHEAQNSELGALVLCNMSHLATWQERPRVGIDHAVAAQGWAKRTEDPLLRAYAADVAARAYAMDGQRDACLGELDDAQEAVATAEGQTLPSSLAYFYGQGQLDSTRSNCFLRLHDARQATVSGVEALRLIDPSFVRNRAFSTLRLGSAYVESNDVDQAARLVGQAATLAARNRSARLVGELRTTRGQLQPWAKTKAVRELDELVVAYGLA